MTSDIDEPTRPGLSPGLLTLVFVGVLVVGGAVVFLLEDDGVAEIGSPAPAIAVNTFDDEVFDMVEHFRFDRRPVVLNLWASWCPPCLEEFPALSAFSDENPDVAVVGVAVRDQFGPAERFVEEIQPTFTVGFDRDGDVETAYPSFGLPTTFLIDSDGVVIDIVTAQLTPELLESLTEQFDSGADGSA